MANQRAETLEQHQHEVCNAFARAAVAMRDAANTAENFSNWFSRVNNLQSVPVPAMFNGSTGLSFVTNYGGPQHQYPSQPTAPEQAGKKRKAADEPEGKKKRQPKEKKPRDANAPKRPPSPYLLFQNEIRKSIQAKNPEIPYSQLLTEISKIWKGMTPDQRAPYMQSQAVMKAKYEQDKADYQANPAGAADVSTPTEKAPAAPAESKKPVAAVPTTSDESSDESAEPSSPSDGDEDDQEEAVPTPEPPRKKSKKEVEKRGAAKEPIPPPAKKKEKSGEGKKKKTADT